MDRNSREFQALLRVHEGLPRQGPGSTDATTHALGLLPPMPQNARIYDLGCGPGLASMVLARLLQQKIIAVDLADDFVRQVRDNAIKQGLSQLIDARCGDMIALDDPPDSIDLIWSEGAIYCVGFDNALRIWRPLLKKKGLVACTELSWLKPDPSLEAEVFWKEAYPGMRQVSENIAGAEQLGYACMSHFTLPESCWWDEYYAPLLANIECLRVEAECDDVLAGAISNASSEIDLFRRRNQEYGYVFYVLQNSEVSIEPGVSDDAQEIARVLRKSFNAALPFLPILHTPDEDLHYISEEILPKNRVYVARNETREIVGYIAFSDEWINHLYLLPEYAHKGIGTRMLNIAKLCNRKLRLWTFQRNEIAKCFYTKHGFKIVQETDGSGNEEKEPDFLFEWSSNAGE